MKTKQDSKGNLLIAIPDMYEYTITHLDKLSPEEQDTTIENLKPYEMYGKMIFNKDIAESFKIDFMVGLKSGEIPQNWMSISSVYYNIKKQGVEADDMFEAIIKLHGDYVNKTGRVL